MKRKPKSMTALNRPFRPMKPLTSNGEKELVYHDDQGTTLRIDKAHFWQNNMYACAVYDDDDDIGHCTIQRLDCTPARDWRHLQAIKNQLYGEDRQAIEIYPPQNDVLDVANTTHLWVLPKGKELDIGLESRSVAVVKKLVEGGGA